MPAVRVVTLESFAERIRESLAIPAEVIASPTESGDEMAALVRDADVLVNGVFRA